MVTLQISDKNSDVNHNFGRKWVYAKDAMKTLRKNSTFVSRFVLAFLCLNLGGALCLTYCTQGSKAASVPSAGLSSHCQKHQAKLAPNDSDAASANAATCCAMPVSLIAAPIEKTGIFSFDSVVVPETFVASFETLQISTATRRSIERVYRPPPLDHSTDRVRNCVFRI